jgi:hypothetical protein
MRTKTILTIFLFAQPIPLLAQLPAGSVAQYSFNNSAIDITGNGFDGTLASTAGASNRFGTANSATGFTAGSSTGTLPGSLVVALQDDFTIAYWFNTTMTAPSSTQWYGGSAMVDAEVCGGTSDWGTALINGGEVSMGIGNPDVTITSPGTYNDGNWHFVTATRNEAAGIITLYVDGAQVATISSTATTPRIAPPLIGLGRNPCAPAGVFTGRLDDIIAYNRVLSATEVSNLFNYFNSVPLPLTWESFSGQASGDRVQLNWQIENAVNNDHFEIERSTDDRNFSTIGIVQAVTTVWGPGSYDFTDPSPEKGSDFYRIRQVDFDGSSSWSSTVVVAFGLAIAGLHLQTNPVPDDLILVNPGNERIRRLQILDLTGRIMVDHAVNSSNSLITQNVRMLRPGYYLLRAIGSNAVTIRFVRL